jgi:hypothetical protein
LFIAILLSAAALVAQTPEERGLQIAQEADKRDEGFVNLEATLTMILRNRHGQESTRYMRNKTLEMNATGINPWSYLRLRVTLKEPLP